MADHLAGRMDAQRAEAIRSARVRSWAEVTLRRPVLFALLVTVLAITTLRVLTVLTRNPTDVYTRERGDLVAELAACVLLVVLIRGLGWWRTIGFSGPNHWRQVRLMWLPLSILAVLLALLLQSGVTSDARWLATSLPYMFLVGFFEEALFRGLVLFLLLYAWRDHPRGVVAAVLVSSVAFGIVHLVNLAEGEPLGSTLVQVGYATMVGVGLAGLALRTNTLWLGVMWHSLVDVIGQALPGPDVQTMPADAPIGLLPLLVNLPLFIYGLVLIRRKGKAPRTADPCRQ